MIDEAELSELLTQAAATFEVPERGEESVLAAATGPAGPARRPVPGSLWQGWRPRRPRLAIGVTAGVVVLGMIFAVGALVGPQQSTSKFNAVGRSVNNGDQGAAGAAQAGGANPQSGTASSGASAGPNEGLTAGAAGGSAGPAQIAHAPAAAPTQSDVRPLGEAAKIVKTGSLQLEVRRGAVPGTMGRLTVLATGVNGYVADTKTNEGGEAPSGSITLRVPADTFEDVLNQARALGTPRAVTSHGQDVTAQAADIQARLTALNATRDQLLTILRKATAIGDVLAVQDRINQVQTETEQLQGQQRVLNDQASYGTLSVDVAQQGATLPAGPPPERSGLAKAWHDAVHGFTSGVEAIIGGSGTALLILLILAALGAAGWGAWVVLRRRLV